PALGQAILAFEPFERQRETLERSERIRLSEKTITDVDQLMNRLSEFARGAGPQPMERTPLAFEQLPHPCFGALMSWISAWAELAPRLAQGGLVPQRDVAI